MKVVLRLWLSVLLLVVSLLLGIALARPLAVPSMAGSEQPVYEFIGPVVSLPEGIFGTWIIGQTRVEVTAETQLDRAKRKLRPGIWVQVRGERIPTGLQARAVRVLSPEAVPNRVELHGVVEETSDNTWVVSGTRVTLTSQTRIVGPVPGMYGTSPVGAVASVTAFWEGTTLVADIIRLRTLAEEAQEVEFLGRLEAVRGNVWVVDGVEVTVPEQYMGDGIGALNSRRGKITSVDQDNRGKAVIQAFVPLAETFGYATDLRNKTQGRAEFVMEFDHYAPVPQSVEDQVRDKVAVEA